MSEQTAEAHAEAIKAEYSKYVAKEAITLDGVNAFAKGDAVPISTVESGKVSKDQVVGANTQAAKAVTAPTKEG